MRGLALAALFPLRYFAYLRVPARAPAASLRMNAP